MVSVDPISTPTQRGAVGVQLEHYRELSLLVKLGLQIRI